MVQESLAQILASARRRNAAVNISGALMFNADYFAQVLEGPLQSVEDTFERIQCDPHHEAVVILDFKPCQSRQFGKWSMGYVGTDTAASLEFDHLTSGTEFDPQSLSGDRITELARQHLLGTNEID